MRITNFLCLTIVLAACTKSATKQTSRELLPEPDRVERLKSQKADIDSNRMTKHLTAKIYAKEPNIPKPTMVVDLKWPKDIDEVYNVWYDQDSNIVCIGAYPNSQTGDWHLGLTHYFDESGNTFAFERNTSFYNSLCTEDLAIEHIVTYYHANALVDSVYILTDVKGNNLEKDSCEFPYDFPYRIFTNSKDVLRNVGIAESPTRHN